MEIYATQVVPRILNVACARRALRTQREEACSNLFGRALEIGFGSGLNTPFYPGAVTSVDAIEPADVAWKLAARRIARCGRQVRRAGLDAEALPLPSNTFDTALSTWTLCTIPDAAAALHEVRRVLKPGGTLHFVEHGLAPDEQVRRWQHRLDPLHKRFAGGCCITRPITTLLTDTGFRITQLTTFYQPHTVRPLGAQSFGTAVSP